MSLLDQIIETVARRNVEWDGLCVLYVNTRCVDFIGMDRTAFAAQVKAFKVFVFEDDDPEIYWNVSKSGSLVLSTDQAHTESSE